MPRYVFFDRSSPAKKADLERIRNTPGVSIVDETKDRAVLVEASEATIGELRLQLSGWLIAPETRQSLPRPPRMGIEADSDLRDPKA